MRASVVNCQSDVGLTNVTVVSPGVDRVDECSHDGKASTAPRSASGEISGAELDAWLTHDPAFVGRFRHAEQSLRG